MKHVKISAEVMGKSRQAKYTNKMTDHEVTFRLQCIFHLLQCWSTGAWITGEMCQVFTHQKINFKETEISISIMCSDYVEKSNNTNQIRMFLIVLHNLESEENVVNRKPALVCICLFVCVFVCCFFFWNRYWLGLCDKSN